MQARVLRVLASVRPRWSLTGGGAVLLDLVAEPVPAVEEPREVVVEGATILVDTPHEIFVSKLCTLLERSELRDLQDVRVLLEGGEDLERALREAPSKDAGFSPLTLAWVLRQMPISTLARVGGLSNKESMDLERFRDELVERITALASPE